MSVPFFDTSIIVDWLKRRPEARVELTRYAGHRISRLVWAEVLSGEAPERRDIVQQLIAPFEVVELDARIAGAAAMIRYRSQMNLSDALILATAQINGAILVTRNTQAFPAALPGIRVPYVL